VAPIIALAKNGSTIDREISMPFFFGRDISIIITSLLFTTTGRPIIMTGDSVTITEGFIFVPQLSSFGALLDYRWVF
jgi:hypothetical protein